MSWTPEKVEKLIGLEFIIALIESSPGQLFWSTTKTLYSPGKFNITFYIILIPIYHLWMKI